VPASIQYTIRGIPESVDAALRREAEQEGLSLNQVVLRKLSQALAESPRQKRRDLSFLRDGWKPDANFEASLAEQRRIDPDLWK
jgi:hypothetical protein